MEVTTERIYGRPFGQRIMVKEGDVAITWTPPERAFRIVGEDGTVVRITLQGAAKLDKLLDAMLDAMDEWRLQRRQQGHA